MSMEITDNAKTSKCLGNTGSEHLETEKCERLTRLPIARIRTLVKADDDVSIASQESIFLITKATIPLWRLWMSMPF
ncbi:unnamed protein product [Clavelina lepadiformis]|uniref:Transcription factor CBF/NF-Y/archaeal histone domain-containing protein n=1 Tax=Clavelina lepadiformis TaxID=159417 RepID=A0ABP0G131_CLALP